MESTIYRIFTRVEQGDGGYRAVAVAIPENRPLRCAPERRVRPCIASEEARRLLGPMARQLAADLGRRGLRCLEALPEKELLAD